MSPLNPAWELGFLHVIKVASENNSNRIYQHVGPPRSYKLIDSFWIVLGLPLNFCSWNNGAFVTQKGCFIAYPSARGEIPNLSLVNPLFSQSEWSSDITEDKIGIFMVAIPFVCKSPPPYEVHLVWWRTFLVLWAAKLECRWFVKDKLTGVKENFTEQYNSVSER